MVTTLSATLCFIELFYTLCVPCQKSLVIRNNKNMKTVSVKISAYLTLDVFGIIQIQKKGIKLVLGSNVCMYF